MATIDPIGRDLPRPPHSVRGLNEPPSVTPSRSDGRDGFSAESDLQMFGRIVEQMTEFLRRTENGLLDSVRHRGGKIDLTDSPRIEPVGHSSLGQIPISVNTPPQGNATFFREAMVEFPASISESDERMLLGELERAVKAVSGREFKLRAEARGEL